MASCSSAHDDDEMMQTYEEGCTQMGAQENKEFSDKTDYKGGLALACPSTIVGLYGMVSPEITIDCQHSRCCEEPSTDGQHIAALPAEISTDGLHMAALPAEISTDGLNIAALPAEISTDGQHIAALPAEISTDGLHIAALPAEILYLILRKFRHDELCKYVAPVCRHWYKLTYDPILWTHISFRNIPKISHESACRLLVKAPMLRTLDLNRLPCLAVATLPTAVQYCQSLRSLDLGFCDTVNKEMLQLIATGCKQLVNLNIEGCSQIDHSDIEALILSQRLNSVNLSHCTRLLDNSIAALASGLTELVNLNIDGIVWIQRSAMECLSMKCSETLERLDLDGAELEDESIKLLCRCTNLVRLSLSFAELLTDACLANLTNLCKLEELRLRKGCQFSSYGLCRMLSQTIPGRNLRSLDLTECTRLNDDGVLALSTNCVKLWSLSLSWCWHISDRGLAAIVDYCHELVVLNLVGIHSITGVCLGRVPETMPNLRHMDLQHCNEIIDDLVLNLVRRQPKMTVINYYGEEFIWRDKEDPQ